MKIVIEKGTSIEDAIKLLSNFLTESYSEYPILKNDATMYITLKNFNGQFCPDNQQEFCLLESGIKNKREEAQKYAINLCLSQWKYFIESFDIKKRALEKKIKTDCAYLESAVTKGRKPENVKKRKAEYQRNLKSLEDIENEILLISYLQEAVNTGNYRTIITQYNGKNPYDYTLEAALQFADINGWTGYFNGRSLKRGIL